MNSSNPSQSQSSAAESTASSTLGEKAQNLKATAAEKARQLKGAAASTVSRAKDEAEHLAEKKKVAAAERIGGYGSAIHESAKSLEEKDPNLAWFTHRAAERVDRVADYIRNRDFRDVRNDVEDFAHRHPAVFFGGLFVAGLFVGNVVKASARGNGRTSEETPDESDQNVSDWSPEQSSVMQNESPATSAEI